MKKILFACLLFSFYKNCFSQTIQTESTIESIGYEVSNLGSFSPHISVSSRFRVASGTWRNGYEPGITAISGQTIIAGSFFELDSATAYDIEITIVDSFPTIHSQAVTTTATTMAEPVFPFSSDTLWVSPVGSGSLYTYASPGKFDQLFKSNYSLIKCGTIISCRGGIYYTGDLQYTPVNTNCSTHLPVTIMSAPGEHAVFDGSDSSAAATFPNWALYDAGAKIYHATLPQIDSFSTQLMLDTTRLFPYAVVYPQSLGFGTYYESLSNCDTYFGSGFYRNGNSFFVKLSGGADPTGKRITVSKHNRLFSLYNNPGNDMHFTFRNLEIRNYGKPRIGTDIFGNISSETSAIALYFSKMKSTIIDSCTFLYNTFSVNFISNFDSTIIQHCNFKDQTGLWSHGAYKNSSLTEHPDISGLNDNGKFGRALETMPVWFDANNTSSRSIIIRKNTFDGFVQAIAGRGDATGYTNLVYSTDISDNVFKNNYNIVVPIGNSLNFRFFRNTVTNFLVGLSLIDNAIGPVYMFRNVFDEIVGRDNPSNLPSSYNPSTYVNYNGCLGLKNKVWSTILKLNAGATPLNQRYDLHIVHNTLYSTDSLGYNFYLWEKNWKNIKCVNNSFNAVYCIHNFENANADTTFQFSSLNDNYYSANGFVGAVNPNHGTTNCYNDQNLDSLQSHLKLRSGNYDAMGINIQGFTFPSDFVNASQHDFNLLNTSQLIDKGVIVNNISDVLNVNYYGNSPDIGAKENSASANSVKYNALSSNGFLVFPNPSTGNFTVYVGENFRGAKLSTKNILGEQIGQTIILRENSTAVSIEGNKGIYFLELIQENGKRENFKIIKD